VGPFHDASRFNTMIRVSLPGQQEKNTTGTADGIAI
jgi:hypothetical protein